MSYVRIWVHLVFSTKNRYPFIKKDIRKQFINHIYSNCKKKEILLASINGYEEHIHCLLSIQKEQSISKMANLIKGESSYWFNKQQFIKEKFNWQDDYFAVYVGESQIDRVKRYIANQDTHHRNVSCAEESDEFMQKYGFGENFNMRLKPDNSF